MEQTKQTIFFKDLIFTVLYRWKALVIVMMIFGLLLGGFAVVNNRKEVSLGGANMTPQNLDLIDQLKVQIEFLETSIEDLQAHNEGSVMMNLNPFASYSCVLQLFVEPEGGLNNGYDPSPMVMQAYRSLLLDNETIDALAEKNGMSGIYFRELLNFTSPEEKYLQITVYGESMDQAAAYAADIQAALLSYEADIDETVYAHNVVVTSFCTGPKVDTTLFDKQNVNLNKLKNWESDLTALKTRLGQLEPSALAAASSNPVLFAIIGAFLGACIVVVCAWCGYLCGSKVYNAKVLENRTGVRILGCVASGKKQDFLNRWFRKLDGRAQHTDAEAAAVNVRNLCKDAKKVLFMGTFTADVMDCITEKLTANGVEAVVCPDPMVKADALEALPTCDLVVLAETCGRSRYETVEWAIQTVADHEKTLLGCVLIDG